MSVKKTLLFALLALVILCSSTASIGSAGDEEKNTAAMRRFYDEVMNKGNLKVIDELVDPQFVDHYATPGIPADKAGLTQMMTMFRAAFPDMQVTVLDIIAKGDKVWAYTVMRSTHKGEFMGMKATGKTIDVKSIDIVRFVNGKAVEHWGLNDDLTMMQQLGVIPMPEQAGMSK
ncbi:MAG: ester cyclase [candidate division KSB1 bacterium]|nr:ester cyclase [candidate division KSB1 bacterium]MDZ7302847.1 ester cyclase [candidate division KSB1 bacterium]MDZ7311864.1 ester cyclase [candidate division KSB1 bacterium]